MTIENYQTEDIRIENENSNESTETEVDTSENIARMQAEYENIETQINEYQNLVNRITNEKDKKEIQNNINTAKDLLENDNGLTNDIIRQIQEILSNIQNEYFNILNIIETNVETADQDARIRARYLKNQIEKEDYRELLGETIYNNLVETNADTQKFNEKAEEILKNKTTEEKVLIINEISKEENTETLCMISNILLGPDKTGMCTIGEEPPLNICCIKYQKGYIIIYNGNSYYGDLPENAITKFIVGNINNQGITISLNTESKENRGIKGTKDDKIVGTSTTIRKTNINIDNPIIPITFYMKARTTQLTGESQTKSSMVGIGMNIGYKQNINNNISIGIGGGAYKNFIEQEYTNKEGTQELTQGIANTPREYNLQGTLILNNINTYAQAYTQYNKEDGITVGGVIGYTGKNLRITTGAERNKECGTTIYGNITKNINKITINLGYERTVGTGTGTLKIGGSYNF